MRVDLVTRAGCHLCEQMLHSARRLGLEPRQLNVDSDPDLQRLYDFRLPVLLVEGRVVGEGVVDEVRLARTLGLPDVRVGSCGAEAAEVVKRLTEDAFRGYDRLDPPSSAGRENLEGVRAELAARGGALAWRCGD
ncbi:MAG: glutaredoxin family protein, partial [Candidatus Dormibacteraeota bacterium]|nr:glutaredoxin family protein [Candidatus Dormibacteraeota bacterium]